MRLNFIHLQCWEWGPLFVVWCQHYEKSQGPHGTRFVSSASAELLKVYKNQARKQEVRLFLVKVRLLDPDDESFGLCTFEFGAKQKISACLSRRER